MCHYRTRRGARGDTPVWFAGVIAVLLLVIAGVAYRAAAARVLGKDLAPVRLPIPLAQLPLEVDGWKGQDVPIAETIQEYMRQNFADDYINRRYVQRVSSLWADVYVVYCSSKPGGILGHRPGVCYPNNGWIHDGTEPSQIISHSGRPINCLIHRFHRPAPSGQGIVVLSFYVLNGQITLSEDKFSGFWGRRPNLTGDWARYVAQVQVSSEFENSARTAAAQLADTILLFLPDEKGHVGATDMPEFTRTGKTAESSK